MSVPPKRLPEVLRSEIQRRGLTQYRIAKDTGIPQPTMSRFLRGGSLRLETVATLLDYLGFEVTLAVE